MYIIIYQLFPKSDSLKMKLFGFNRFAVADVLISSNMPGSESTIDLARYRLNQIKKYIVYIYDFIWNI